MANTKDCMHYQVRKQLTKEMREENAIRRQLNMQADAQGEKMLKDELSNHKSNKSAPHVLTKKEMETQVSPQASAHIQISYFKAFTATSSAPIDFVQRKIFGCLEALEYVYESSGLVGFVSAHIQTGAQQIALPFRC